MLLSSTSKRRIVLRSRIYRADVWPLRQLWRTLLSDRIKTALQVFDFLHVMPQSRLPLLRGHALAFGIERLAKRHGLAMLVL